MEPILPRDAVSLGPVPEQTRTGGEGIPAEQMLRVFQRFHRGDTAGNRKHRGSAIGLMAGWIIVDTPDGSPSAFSDWGGHRSTFKMRLPLDLEGIA